MNRSSVRLAVLVVLAVVAVGVVAAAGLTTLSSNSDGAVVIAPNGPGVTLTGNGDVYSTSGQPASNTIQWNTTAGNATFVSQGRTNVTVHRDDLTGTWTIATAIDSNGNDLTINPADKPSVTVGGGIDSIEFRGKVAADDGTTDFVYSASSSASLTIHNAPDSTQLRAIDTSTGAYLDGTTSDASGTATFSDLDSGSHDVVLKAGNAAPTVSTPQPEGNLSSATTTLSIDVNDSDFGATGDNVSVEFQLDGSSVGTDSLTSNGTASVSISQPTSGTHSVTATATDDFGATASQSWTFGVPDELLIYNESSPNTLVQSPTETTVTFYASNGSVYTRSTTNGKIDFAGLPADEAFIVEADAQDYISRRIYIESLIEQQRIYLLPENATTASVVFSLRDDSGQFTPVDETLLYIEKPMNVSGQTKYQVITSDQFSATREVPVTLENDQRYRLRIKGSDGDTRVLGAYRTAGDDTATLNVGRVQFDSGAEADSPVFQSSMTTINGQQTIRIKYLDPVNATDGLTLKVVNESSGNVLRPKTTESGPFGEYVETIPVSGSAEGHTYNVTYDASRTGYEDVSGQQYAGDLPGILGDLGLDVNILSMLGYLTILGVLGLTAISYPRYAGIPTTAVAAALVTLGAVQIPPLLVGGAGVISLMFAVGGEGVRS